MQVKSRSKIEPTELWQSKNENKAKVKFDQYSKFKGLKTFEKHSKMYLTAFGVTPPPRDAATSLQNVPALSKLTCLPMLIRRSVFSVSLVQVNGIV